MIRIVPVDSKSAKPKRKSCNKKKCLQRRFVRAREPGMNERKASASERGKSKQNNNFRPPSVG